MRPFQGVRGVALRALAALVVGVTVAASPAAAAEPFKIVALGDSLTAGYGLPADAAFPVVLEKALKARGWNVAVSNAGVSGDTATGGLARLDWSVPDGTKAVILELGANDMLRGVDPAITARALDTIMGRLQARGVPVLVAGMLAAPNFGADYVASFNRIYGDLGRKYDAPVYPFFLDGVTGVSRMTLPDGLHPTREGVALVVERILPAVERFLKPLAGTH